MDKKLIAVTGGIGSGKSTVMDVLEGLGYKTLSSDKIVSELYEKRSVKKLLKSLFPTAVTGKIKLNIDRAEISRLVFNNPTQLKALTDLITPLVLNEILRRYKKATCSVFAEVPLLFECGFEKHFDKVFVVVRDLEGRIESVKRRSKLSKEQILARINSQFDYENADLSNYIVIENNGTKEQLKEKITDLVK
ncbi:MAG: dephospho-CoA kinase [Clostridia bacterium]|nr:dephospho-CoA kinase [Clostridia bacterium]